MAALESVGAKKALPSVGPPHLWGAWWGRLLSAEASVSQATVMLMASFLISAMLGSLQQLLFNAQFGAGADREPPGGLPTWFSRHCSLSWRY